MYAMADSAFARVIQVPKACKPGESLKLYSIPKKGTWPSDPLSEFGRGSRYISFMLPKGTVEVV
jgi:hypothetical protein